jgi:hypothetical protein
MTLAQAREKNPMKMPCALNCGNKDTLSSSSGPSPSSITGTLSATARPDLIVDGSVIVDAKSIDSLGDPETAQMLNYPRIARLGLGLVLNFKPPKLEVKRVAL